MRNSDILGSLSCLKIHAVRLCTLGTDRSVQWYFLHTCGHSDFQESLKSKFFPKQLTALVFPSYSAGAVNYIFVLVAYLPSRIELNHAILAVFCSLVYLVASRLGLSILFQIAL